MLPLTVFITGACILIIEIVATRILSPHYGNTIFTVSSVISVILAALSLGYHFGGRLADKRPELKWFYGLIAVSGTLVLVFHVLGALLLPTLSDKLSLTSGPFVSSLALFFIPALLLGTLSPYAVKLQSDLVPKEGIGTVSGDIFFWSTLGSIVGSLSAGFVLIPMVGLNEIIFSVGGLLFLLGFIPTVILARKDGGRSKTFLIILAGTAISLIYNVPAMIGDTSAHTVYQKDGVYEKITIYDSTHDGRPTRFFQQDHSSSGAMFLDTDDPTDLVYDYTKYYALYKLFTPEPQEALVIGGGAYSIPKALLHDEPQLNVDVSEIEPSLYDLSKKYFQVQDDERLKHIVKDGRRLLTDREKQYDIIFSDVYYSYYSVPAHFTTQEFFETAKESLSSDGIFVANMIGSLTRVEPSLIMSEMRTFKNVFKNSYFFGVDSTTSTETQNIIFVGSNSDKVLDFDTKEVLQDPNPIISELADRQIDTDRFELSPYALLTDNYAPVDYLTSKLLRDDESASLGENALMLIDQQLRYGPRHLGSSGHAQVQKFITAELESMPHIATSTQAWEHKGDGGTSELENIIGRVYPERRRRIILGTHYDTKKHGDDGQPVPGANDGASGTALLLELARTLNGVGLPQDVGIDFVFFDGEEGESHIGGDYSGWVPLGSTYFAKNLDKTYGSSKPEAGIILDMVCDMDLRLKKERSSTISAGKAVDAFWDVGKDIDATAFDDEIMQIINDDHTPLNAAGVPSFLVIDFDYPPFHTAGDTLDKCSAASLDVVGRTVREYLRQL